MYEAYYGFRANPFRLAPDPQFFYESSCHKRALSYLRYGLQQSQGFVVVTGIPGTGKSLLIQTLFSELADRRMVIAMLSNTNLCDVDILRAVANCFDIHYPDDNKAGLLGAIERFLIDQGRQGKHVLLIVDEAQNVPKRSLEELRMLTNFQSGDKALMQIMLLGQQQLQQILADPTMEQLTQRVIASCNLTPFTLDDMRGYIEHRLLRVGWQGRPSFSCEALRSIHHYSRGVPRLVNNFCDRLLLAACLDEKDEIDQAHLDKVMDELREEATGVWREIPPPTDVACDIEPLPGKDFVAPKPVSIADSVQVNSHAEVAPSQSDVARPKRQVDGTPPVSKADEVVTPHYATEDNGAVLPPSKKGLFGGYAAKPSYPEISPAALLDGKEEYSVKIIDREDEVDQSPQTNVEQEVSSTVALSDGGVESQLGMSGDDQRTYPEDKPFDPDADPSVPQQVNSDTAMPASKAKGRWWVVPTIVGVIVAIGLAFYVIVAKGYIDISSFLSEVSLPQVLSQPVAQAASVQTPAVVPAEDSLTQLHTSDVPPAVQASKPKVEPVVKPIEQRPPPVLEKPVVEKKVVVETTMPTVRPSTPLNTAQNVPGDALAPPLAMLVGQGKVAAKEKETQKSIAPPEQLEPIDAEELPDLLYSFAFAYESGNLEQFMKLFSKDASADGSIGHDAIASDYAKLFVATDMRSMQLKDVAWKPEVGKARGDGRFEVTVWKLGNVTPSTVKGQINFEVIKKQQRLYIQSLTMAVE